MRSTRAGVLEGVEGQPTPPRGRPLKAGGFSVVVDDRERGPRRLPSLYVNDVQLFADRDVARVQAALRRTVDAFVRSGERATYMLTACEIGGRKGLYGTDFFNRSAYRRKLEGLGMRFSSDPFVVFGNDGTFGSQDRAPFVPEFLALGAPGDDAGGVQRVGGALLLQQLTFYRIADVAEEELRRLASLAERLDAFSAADPGNLAATLAQ